MKKHSKRESAVSSILKAQWSNYEQGNPTQYELCIANSDDDKNLAYHLGYSVYLSKNYIEVNKSNLLTETYDKDDGTAVVLAKDNQGNAIASVTIVFNKYSILPCSSLFSCSKTNKSSAELTRLVIKDEYKNEFSLLAELMVWAFTYAEEFEKTHQFLIEVNPKHQSFYKRALGFSQLHDQKKPCLRVAGAPAVLLAIKLADLNAMSKSNTKMNSRLSIFKTIYQNKKNDIIEAISDSQVHQKKRKQVHFNLF